MKSRFSSPRVWALPLIGLGLAAGCGVTPMAPGRGVSLAVTLQRLNSISPALLGASQNEIYFHLDGAGAPSGHWAYGPFSAPVSTGSVTITIRIPAGSNASVLSLQLNNASTHQPLALGATQFNYGSGVVVDMGSVTRNCYYTDASNPLLNSGKGSVYIFSSDTLVAGSPTLGSSDIAFNFGSPNQFFMEEAANAAGPVANSIAYMGQGDMVDHDGVPPASAFYPYSYQSKSSAGAAVTNLEAGDVYCVKASSLKGGYAWVQITDPGVVNTRAPNFRFRVNTTKPYYAYEQTTADLNGQCSTNY